MPEFLWGFEPRAPPTLWGSRGVSPHYQFPLPWGSFEWQESSGDSSLDRHRPSGGREASPRTTNFRSPGGLQVPGILLGFEARAPPTLWYKFPLPWGSFECQESFGDSSLGRHRPSGGREAPPRTTCSCSPGGALSARNPLGIPASGATLNVGLPTLLMVPC